MSDPTILAALSALLLGGFQDAPPAVPREAIAVSVSDATEEQEPYAVRDVVVSGRSVADQARAFVGAVAAPPSRRGLARWQDKVCVGVANLRNDVAMALADHVSRIAVEVGLRVSDPGCSPNILVIFSDDAKALATGLVQRDRRAFRLGVGGLDRGNKALAEFQTSERPIRWWHVSMPVIGLTGERAIRMPGDTGIIFVTGEGLVHAGRPINDAFSKVIIIVDANELGGATLPQLGDYIAFVSLLQVDPDGNTRGFPTILNLFDDPQAVSGFSEWDRSYLASLYDAYPERVNPWDQAAAMARNIKRTEVQADREANPRP